MRFTQLVHPEVALGKRGPTEVIRQLEGWSKFIDRHISGAMPREIAELPTADRHHLMMVYYYRKHRDPAYHFARDFLEALSTVDREVPFHLLPDNFRAYISFSSGVVKSLGKSGYLQGAYVEISRDPEINGGEKTLYASIIGEFTKSTTYPIWFINLELSGESIRDKIAELKGGDFETDQYLDPKFRAQGLDAWVRAARILVNAICYIHSQNPEVTRKESDNFLSRSKRSQMVNRGELVNECTIPIQFVNWNWKRPKTWHVDSTVVEGHFRWQACGPGFSQRKFIYIDEHTRILGGESESK